MKMLTKPNISLRDNSLSSPYIGHNTRSGWVSFGANNNFPNEAIDLANSSPLQKSIIDNKISYIMGAGVAKTVDAIYTPNLDETWSEMLFKCVCDYVYLDAFAIEVIPNESGNKFTFYHRPINQVRLGQYNDNGIIEKSYLCTNWLKSNRQNVVEIKMWGTETPKKGEHYLMYFKKYNVGNIYYPIPSWYAAANYVAADSSLSQYYQNYITNNFSANIVLKFPDEPTEEKKQELYENLMASFGGSENAGNILLLFGENGVLPEISPIESVDADLYNQVVDVVKMGIVSANRLTSPVLAGISTSTGFSSKSDEIIAATVQYRLTVINPERQFILKAFNDLLSLNGYDRVLTLQDYNLTDEFNGNVEENTDKLNEGVGAADTEEQMESEG